MTEEFTKEEKQECFCKSKGFRKFLTIALATFVGVYSALCLFFALHRPPMIPPCPYGYGAPAPVMAPCHFKKHRYHFDKEFRGDRGDFQKAIKEHKAPAPFDKDRVDD